MNPTTPSFVYHYFFSFVVVGARGDQFANGTLTRTAPITSIDDLNQIGREAAQNAGVAAQNLIVLSYSLLCRTSLEQQ